MIEALLPNGDQESLAGQASELLEALASKVHTVF